MEDRMRVVKHLEMLQGIINRLGHNSFLVKGWSMTLLVAGMILFTRNEAQSECAVLIFCVPVLGFWLLDGYFLSKERSFRKVYDQVRQQKNTDFSMNPKGQRNRVKCEFMDLIFSLRSLTLIIFYGMEFLFVFLASLWVFP